MIDLPLVANAATTWTAVGAVGSCSASVVALILALFPDKLRRWLRRGTFRLTVGHVPPFFQQVPFFPGDDYMVRLKVINSTTVLAEVVRVVITSLERLNIFGDDYERVPSFIPIALKWTHDDRPVLDFLSPGEDRFLDFGMLRPHREAPMEWRRLVLHLSTEVGAGFEVLSGGTYRVRLLAYTKDGPRLDTILHFSFRGRDIDEFAGLYGDFQIQQTTPPPSALAVVKNTVLNYLRPEEDL